MAVVIIGGLLTSTLLDFFVTPAIFYRFGRGSAQRLALEYAAKCAAETVQPIMTPVFNNSIAPIADAREGISPPASAQTTAVEKNDHSQEN